jgi:predicted phosphodiesterase
VSNKELDIREERLDDLISWIVEQITSNVSNISFIKDNYDNGIAKVVVRGLEYIMVHGDFDSANANSINKLCTMIGEFPYAVLAGHRHTPMSAEFNGIKYIQSGSLSESGDSYTISKRLKGDASQTVLVCNTNGIQCTYNVTLS